MVKVVDVEINIADMKAKDIPTKSGATAWMELAKKERAAHYKAWGYIQKNKFTQNTPRNKKDWKDNPRKREFKRRGTQNPQQLAAIREMRRNGLTMDAIATELKISEGSVRYWCQTYNIKKGEG
jgi:DNA-binding transcriptional regulator YiaG